MKKLLITIFTLIIGIQALAAEKDEALNFFNNYVSASNNYSASILNMYASDAKIIRQIVKPDGKLANAYFTSEEYKGQMKLSSKVAKLRNYKNNYSNINVTKVSNGYKIDALRQPSGENYKLKAYMIVEKQSTGRWLITEEMMQTKVQTLLKYAK